MKKATLFAHASSFALIAALYACTPGVPALSEHATELLSEGRADEAVQMLEAARARVGDDPDLCLALARAAAAAFDFDRAVDALRAGLAHDPGNEALTAALARIDVEACAAASDLVDRGDEASARRILEDLRSRGAVTGDVALLAGEAYERMRDLPKAVASYERGFAKLPGDPAYTVALVRVYFNLGQYDLARKTLEQAREAGVGDEDVALSLGVCLGRLGDLDGARREFDRAAAANVDREDLDYNLALLLTADGRNEEALETLDQIVSREPDFYAAKRELARLLLVVRSDDEAARERALQLGWEASDGMPEDWRCLEVIGDAFMAKSDFAAALGAYTEALRLGRNPKRVEGKYVEAKRALDAADAAAASAAGGENGEG